MSTADLPEPPIPADANLKHFKTMPVDVTVIPGSKLARKGNPADNWHAFRLWCASWHQVPAGSLPNDEDDLAYMAGIADSDQRKWSKHRKGAMHGWVLHNDNRWYHPTVTLRVLEALDNSRAGKKAAKTRWEKERGSSGQGSGKTADPKCDGNAQSEARIADAVRSQCQEQNGSERSGAEEASPVGDGAAAPKPAQETLLPVLPVIDPKRVIFGECLDWLVKAEAGPEKSLRSMLGRWCRDYGEPAVIAAFQTASRDPPAGDPIAWVQGILDQGKRNGAGNQQNSGGGRRGPDQAVGSLFASGGRVAARDR